MEHLPISTEPPISREPQLSVRFDLVPSGAYIEIRGPLMRVKLDFHRSGFRSSRWAIEALIAACDKGYYSGLSIGAYLITHEGGMLRIAMQGCDIAWVTATKEVVDAFRWLLTA